MLGRWGWNLITFASVAVLAGVGYYFFSQYQGLRRDQHAIANINRLHEEEGPCSALLAATELGTEVDYYLLRNIEPLREVYAADVIRDGDRRSIRALMSATRDGLISPMLCEQFGLLAELGEMHPVLALLRFTREQDPCEDGFALGHVIDGLGSHRAILLRGLMSDVSKLSCLTPAQSRQVSAQVAAMLHDDAQAFDDLRVRRIASYVKNWAPLEGAQAGCRVKVTGDASRLGKALGCTADQRRRILDRYRYAHDLPGVRRTVEGQTPDVFLLWRAQQRCEVMPVNGPNRLFTVACADLDYVASVDVAVLVDKIEYGVARADMISGLLRYSGQTKEISPSDTEPDLHSWYTYSRTGEPLGNTHVVSLRSIAKQVGENLPELPLRSFCHQAGARYCYDADWTQLVRQRHPDSVVFLSRPLDIFVPVISMTSEARNQLFEAAFQRSARAATIVRVFEMKAGARMVVENEPEGFEIRWRDGESRPWRTQVFGSRKGGRAPPASRLLAVMDLQRDNRPELILQTTRRARVGGEMVDETDEIHLLRLNAAGTRFTPLSSLTVHEF